MNSLELLEFPIRARETLKPYQTMHVSDDLSELTDAQRFLIKYFQQKTKGTRLPKRSDLNPADMVDYLPRIIIYETIYGEDGKLNDLFFRLIGTATAEFYGEGTGTPLSDYHNKPIINRLLESANHALTELKPVHGISQKSAAPGSLLSIRTLFIPMSTDGTHVDILFSFVEWFKQNGLPIERPL